MAASEPLARAHKGMENFYTTIGVCVPRAAKRPFKPLYKAG